MKRLSLGCLLLFYIASTLVSFDETTIFTFSPKKQETENRFVFKIYKTINISNLLDSQ